MILLALVSAAASLAVSLAVVQLLRRAPRIGAQLAGLAFLSVCVPLAVVLFSGWVMFHMGADLDILAVAASSAAAAVVAGLLLARAIARPLRGLGAATAAMAAGDLGARAPLTGSGELFDVAAAFNSMAASLEQLFDARRELVTWASHDLRTPLASLHALIEAAEDGLVEPAAYLPVLRQQTETLTALVDDLFELAQIDAGTLTLDLRRTALTDLVAAVIRTLGPEAAKRRIALEAHIDPAATALIAPEKIERVLTNLISNALYHASAATVVVHVEQRADQLFVHVDDDGTGLQQDEPANMFDRFWRADRPRTTSGAGLGLAIARGLVEAHGGSITAQNRTEGGARISFSLPA